MLAAIMPLLSDLLPGDKIHDVAPISKGVDEQYKEEALQDAEKKRLAKRLKRLKHA
jgi:hypothetical protein